jgi:hypothetical protein
MPSGVRWSCRRYLCVWAGCFACHLALAQAAEHREHELSAKHEAKIQAHEATLRTLEDDLERLEASAGLEEASVEARPVSARLSAVREVRACCWVCAVCVRV